MGNHSTTSNSSPFVRASVDSMEALSPLVRVIRAEEWEVLTAELNTLRAREREAIDEAWRERAATVAWLRSEDYPCCRECNGQLADAIERGDHRPEETP
jgi:hypothetical protein